MHKLELFNFELKYVYSILMARLIYLCNLHYILEWIIFLTQFLFYYRRKKNTTLHLLYNIM